MTGGIYYKFHRFPEPVPWSTAYEETPDRCVLTPVKDMDELEEIKMVVPKGGFPFVGIIKSASKAKIHNAPDADEDASKAGWKNLDGTVVEAGAWAADQPGDVQKAENRAIFSFESQALHDVTAAMMSPHAVYKCRFGAASTVV